MIMDLLAQTIREYLEDRHPYWEINSVRYDSIYIMNTKRRLGRYIIVATTAQEIITNYYSSTYIRDEYAYTDCTLLPQLTEVINKLEQS